MQGYRKFSSVLITMLFAFVLQLFSKLTGNYVAGASLLLTAFMGFNYLQKTVDVPQKSDLFKENREFIVYLLGLIMLFILEWTGQLDALFISILNLVVTVYFGSSFGAKKEFLKNIEGSVTNEV